MSLPVNAAAYVPAGDYWGIPEIAEYLGIQQSTARDYATDPDRGFPDGIEVGGRKLYLVTEVKAWDEARERPGRQKRNRPDPSV